MRLNWSIAEISPNNSPAYFGSSISRKNRSKQLAVFADAVIEIVAVPEARGVGNDHAHAHIQRSAQAQRIAQALVLLGFHRLLLAGVGQQNHVVLLHLSGRTARWPDWPGPCPWRWAAT